MASTVTSTNNLSLRSILEKDKLTGSNFLDWERNLMIVLRHERKWYVLEEPLGEAPPANAPAAARNAHKKHSDDLLDVACLMLATMSPDLQVRLINTNAYDMIRQLRDMFQTQARTERYDATKAFNECKMVKGTSVSDHVMKMKRHLDHLERLGHPVPLQLATNTILYSLSEDYRPFVVNYNMNNMEKTIAELHSMLKTAELNMGNKNKTKYVLMVKDGGVKKKNGHASTSKGKGPVQAIQSAPKKGKGKGKGKKVKPNKARTENRCFICNEIGHWRQNCPKRHEAGRNHSSTQQLRKVAVSHIQELEVSPGSYDQLLNNSYKCCRLKVAQIFDRVANIGRDPRLRLLLGMASTVTSTNNLSLRSILEKDKLTGSNFLDWERNLMIVLRHERKWYVLEEPLGEAPPANAPAAARNAHKKHSDDLLDVACLMLATMSPDLQTGLINTNAYDMIRQLRDMFQTQARTERYDATKAFNECKMVKGTSVSDHVMKMKRHLDHLERLGHPVPLQLATDTILNSLSEDYRPFVVNYNMNNMEKTVAELHSMLKTAELNMGNKNKTKDVLMVKDGGIKKKNGHASTSKGKGPVQAIQSAPKKGKGKGKGKKVKPNKARTENRCFICNEIGHWRQNCPKRHEAGSYDQLLNNSYKCCRLKVAQIFDRVANIGRDPRLRLLLGNSHKSPLNRLEVGESQLIRPDIVQETTDKIKMIQEKLKAARDRQKSYADNHRKPLEFQIGDRVLLKVSPWNGLFRFWKAGKLSPRFIGPFEILERIC
ncbi:hypothetical protein OSB04_024775 [Centaurea solstitialis]|uniref:CCHC-type domain-containing protein n=1 Tax=Centaurea solstitialis TaxID=347529 RepID=A0AA38SME7_9ASTR|nr:hypothetical protein OSB04_024775 [Centaurea solstitialis]